MKCSPPSLPGQRRAVLAGALAIALGAGTPGPASAAGLLGDLFKRTEAPLVLGDDSPARELLSKALDQSDLDLVASREVRRVGISAFQVRYVIDASQSQNKRALGLGQRPESRTNVNYQLEAPPPTVYQAITDHARAELEKALQARGYDVVGQEELLRDTDFAKRVASTEPATAKDPSFFRKDGVVITHAQGTADTFGALQDIGDIKLAERLGNDAALIKVQLTVNFASLEEMSLGERLSAGAASGVKHEVGLVVDGAGDGTALSRVAVVSARGSRNQVLRRPVHLPDAIDKEVRKAEVSGTEVALGVLSSLMGNRSSSVRYVVTPVDNYVQVLGTALDRTARMLAEVTPARTN